MRSFFCLALFLSTSQAAPPALTALFPAGGRRGETVTVELLGVPSEAPLGVHFSSPGLSAKWTPDDKKAKMEVVISPDCPIGAHVVRLLGPEGVSPVQLFIVGEAPELQEPEKRDEPFPVDVFPVIVNGRLARSEEVDRYTVEMAEGEWMIARVDAYRIDSPVDPMLHLRDSEGNQLAFNHDDRALDPLLAFQAKASGRYLVDVSGFAYPPRADVRLVGGDDVVYRLYLSKGPYVSQSLPLSLTKNEPNQIRLLGWGLAEDVLTVTPDADVFILRHRGLVEPLVRPVFPSSTTHLHGVLTERGERDEFPLSLTKDLKRRFTLVSAALGFPVDGMLEILDETGKVLASNDDSAGPDSALDWSPPSEGRYTLTIRDIQGRGGENFAYRVDVDEPTPRFEVSVPGEPLSVKPGEKAELKVAVKRVDGLDAAIEIRATDLPKGVASEGLTMEAKSNEGTLAFSADGDASAGNHLVRLEARAADGAWIPVAIPLKGATSELGDLWVNEDEGLWITVLARSES